MLTGVGPNQPPLYLKVCSLQGLHFYLGLGLILRIHHYLLHMKHFLSAECFGISFYQLLSILKSKQSPGPGRWQTPRFTDSSPCRGPLPTSCDQSKEKSQKKNTMRPNTESMRTPGTGLNIWSYSNSGPQNLFFRAVLEGHRGPLCGSKKI